MRPTKQEIRELRKWLVTNGVISLNYEQKKWELIVEDSPDSPQGVLWVNKYSNIEVEYLMEIVNATLSQHISKIEIRPFPDEEFYDAKLRVLDKYCLVLKEKEDILEYLRRLKFTIESKNDEANSEKSFCLSVNIEEENGLKEILSVPFMQVSEGEQEIYDGVTRFLDTLLHNLLSHYIFPTLENKGAFDNVFRILDDEYKDVYELIQKQDELILKQDELILKCDELMLKRNELIQEWDKNSDQFWEIKPILEEKGALSETNWTLYKSKWGKLMLDEHKEELDEHKEELDEHKKELVRLRQEWNKLIRKLKPREKLVEHKEELDKHKEELNKHKKELDKHKEELDEYKENWNKYKENWNKYKEKWNRSIKRDELIKEGFRNLLRTNFMKLFIHEKGEYYFNPFVAYLEEENSIGNRGPMWLMQNGYTSPPRNVIENTDGKTEFVEYLDLDKLDETIKKYLRTLTNKDWIYHIQNFVKCIKAMKDGEEWIWSSRTRKIDLGIMENITALEKSLEKIEKKDKIEKIKTWAHNIKHNEKMDYEHGIGKKEYLAILEVLSDFVEKNIDTWTNIVRKCSGKFIEDNPKEVKGVSKYVLWKLLNDKEKWEKCNERQAFYYDMYLTMEYIENIEERILLRNFLLDKIIPEKAALSENKKRISKRTDYNSLYITDTGQPLNQEKTKIEKQLE